MLDPFRVCSFTSIAPRNRDSGIQCLAWRKRLAGRSYPSKSVFSPWRSSGKEAACGRYYYKFRHLINSDRLHRATCGRACTVASATTAALNRKRLGMVRGPSSADPGHKTINGFATAPLSGCTNYLQRGDRVHGDRELETQESPRLSSCQDRQQYHRLGASCHREDRW